MKKRGLFKRQVKEVADKVVAITGGARGIGYETAKALAREGAKISIGDIDIDEARRSAAELGQSHAAFELDVTDIDSFRSFLDRTEEELGPVDVLINNAGIMVIGPFIDERDEITRKEVEINLFGVIYGTKLIMPRMRQRGSGHIVNIASAAGRVPLAGEATYCASKHGVVGLTESIQRELLGTGVDVTVVLPNLAKTELASGMKAGRFLKLVEPVDIAQAIVAAIKSGRAEVYVPKSLGFIIKSTMLMPRSIRRVAEKAFATDKIATQFDASARADYVARYSQDGSND